MIEGPSRDTTSHAAPDVTLLLREMSRGNRDAMDDLVPLLYKELRSIAHRHLRGEDTGHTLCTTALVHEAYLRMVDVRRIEWRDRTHFLAMSSRMMRRILMNYARSRKREKRGGDRTRVQMGDCDAPFETDLENLLSLDEALSRLEAVNERRCRVVEFRFFAGLDITETAEALGVSEGTVKRDWRLARIWLNRELGAAGP
ncbi:MAG: sigma-70 family RNA polymerase sigma factor [Gemmatimonadota bacterium]|nr:sigma-70 family RNA polymerase sigma factor [Gemmatimonadota bacterium]